MRNDAGSVHVFTHAGGSRLCAHVGSASHTQATKFFIGTSRVAIFAAKSARLHAARIQLGSRVHVQVDCELAFRTRASLSRPPFSLRSLVLSRCCACRVLLA